MIKSFQRLGIQVLFTRYLHGLGVMDIGEMFQKVEGSSHTN